MSHRSGIRAPRERWTTTSKLSRRRDLARRRVHRSGTTIRKRRDLAHHHHRRGLRARRKWEVTSSLVRRRSGIRARRERWTTTSKLSKRRDLAFCRVRAGRVPVCLTSISQICHLCKQPQTEESKRTCVIFLVNGDQSVTLLIGPGWKTTFCRGVTRRSESAAVNTEGQGKGNRISEG